MGKQHICTKNNPWQENITEQTIHPDAKKIRTEYDTTVLADHYDEYKCPHCNITFKVTLPSH